MAGWGEDNTFLGNFKPDMEAQKGQKNVDD